MNRLEARSRRGRSCDRHEADDVGRRRLLDLELSVAGTFNFVPLLYTDIGMPKLSLKYRLSDHSPLWVEFACTG